MAKKTLPSAVCPPGVSDLEHPCLRREPGPRECVVRVRDGRPVGAGPLVLDGGGVGAGREVDGLGVALLDGEHEGRAVGGGRGELGLVWKGRMQIAMIFNAE